MTSSQEPYIVHHKTVAKNWGNSLGIRIPSKIAEQASIYLNGEVEMSVNSDGIIQIKAVKKQETLMDLLDKITGDNQHEEKITDSFGKEIL